MGQGIVGKIAERTLFSPKTEIGTVMARVCTIANKVFDWEEMMAKYHAPPDVKITFNITDAKEDVGFVIGANGLQMIVKSDTQVPHHEMFTTEATVRALLTGKGTASEAYWQWGTIKVVSHVQQPSTTNVMLMLSEIFDELQKYLG